MYLFRAVTSPKHQLHSEYRCFRGKARLTGQNSLASSSPLIHIPQTSKLLILFLILVNDTAINRIARARN